ncbi:hypothetical protein Q7P37_006104 [Cladosporium fusiforme]
MERTTDSLPNGHQYTSHADGHARQHNGDSILYTQVNHFSLTDSVVNITGAGNANIAQNSSLQTEHTVESLTTKKKDSASLIVHRDDSSSIRTEWTDCLSKLSLKFSFDHALWSTAVYEKKLRPLLKRDIKNDRKTMNQENSSRAERKFVDIRPVVALEEQTDEHQQWPRDIKCVSEEQYSKQRESTGCDTVVLGTSYNSRARLMSRLLEFHDHQFAPCDLVGFGPLIRRDLVHCTKALVNFVSNSDVELDGYVDEQKLLEVLEHGHSITDLRFPLQRDISTAVAALWEDPAILTALERTFNRRIPMSIPYLIKHAARIVSPDYIPTQDDVLCVQSCGVYEVLLACDNRLRRFTHLDCQSQLSGRLLLSIDKPTTIAFCVDLSNYDQGHGRNMLAESIDYFDEIVNQANLEYHETSVFLLLTRANRFRGKLGKSPLSDYFPDFSHGCDVKRAEQYVIQRFRQANRAAFPMQTRTTEMVDLHDVWLLEQWTQRTYLTSLLAGSGFL